MYKREMEQRLEGTGEKASAQMLIGGAKQNCGAKGPCEARPPTNRVCTLGKMSHGGAEIGSFLGVN